MISLDPIVQVRNRFRAFVPRWRAHRLRARPERSDLGERIERCRQGLLQFGRASDKDFTSLARGFSQLSRRLAEMRAKAQQLDLALQDRDEEHALSSAYFLYKKAVDLVHASVGIAVAEQEQMNQIGESLLRACQTSRDFERHHLMLNMLAVNIRKEAVRLDRDYQAVFFNIAASVAEIDCKIVASTRTAFSQIEAVIAEASMGGRELKYLEQNLHSCAQTSIETIRRELTQLKELLAPCAEQSQAIVQTITETERGAAQVIRALQHQDIVRQQLEHVAEGFGDLAAHLDQPQGPEKRATESRDAELSYVHHATKLQRAHLRSSRAEIEQAAEEATAGLRQLLEVADKLVEQFSQLKESAADAFRETRMAEMFRVEIERLAQIAERSEKANDRSSSLVERIERVVRVFSEEIASHEMDVKLVALNAQVSAAQCSSAEALGRLAEETSLVSAQNAAVTATLINNLRGSLDQLQGVKKNSVEFLVIAVAEKRDLRQSVDEVATKLTRLGIRVQADSVGVYEGFQSMREENRSLLEQVSLADLTEDCYAPAEALCRELLESTAAYASEQNWTAAAASKLETHRGRYTMRKENRTHAGVLGERNASADASASARSGDESKKRPADETHSGDEAGRVELAPATAMCRPFDLPEGECAAATPPEPINAIPEAEQPKQDFGDGIELF